MDNRGGNGKEGDVLGGVEVVLEVLEGQGVVEDLTVWVVSCVGVATDMAE